MSPSFIGIKSPVALFLTLSKSRLEEGLANLCSIVNRSAPSADCHAVIEMI